MKELQGPVGNSKMFNICVIWFSEGQDKEVDAENIIEETIARGTLNLVC